MRADRQASTDAAYDDVARDFAARTASPSGTAAAFLHRFMELVAEGVVIDVGCGPGHQAASMRDHGLQVVAADRSEAMVGLCAPGLGRVRSDLASLPVAAGTVDALWSAASLLHVESGAVPDVLEEWERAVRPAGLVAFTTSVGGDAGWELVPADPSRVPNLGDGQRRWFVHHDADVLRSVVRRRGWMVVHDEIRAGHRDWLEIIARIPT